MPRRLRPARPLLAACVILTLGVVLGAAAQGDDDAATPRVVLELPTNPEALRVAEIEPGHYEVTIADEPGVERQDAGDLGYWKWWMFRVDGAAGQTLTFTVHNPVNGNKWTNLNPVYMNGGSLDELDAFTSQPPPAFERPIQAVNGAWLGDTSGQRWHFIEDATVEGHRLTLTHRFTDDRVWIAMRYPFTTGYLRAWLDDIERRAAAEGLNLRRYEIGDTVGGYPMTILTVGEDRDRPRPTMLFYAREHAEDHDASFTVQGAAEFLVSDDPEAQRLRDRFTFVLIPMIDPEGAALGRHDRIRGTFYPDADDRSPEARLYHGWLTTWTREHGQSVDFVINLHNYESDEVPHVHCWVLDDTPPTQRFPERVADRMDRGAFVVRPPDGSGYTRNRFSTMVQEATGAATFGWLVNAQAEQRHLTIWELRDIGKRFVLAAGDVLAN